MSENPEQTDAEIDAECGDQVFEGSAEEGRMREYWNASGGKGEPTPETLWAMLGAYNKAVASSDTDRAEQITEDDTSWPSELRLIADRLLKEVEKRDDTKRDVVEDAKEEGRREEQKRGVKILESYKELIVGQREREQRRAEENKSNVKWQEQVDGANRKGRQQMKDGIVEMLKKDAKQVTYRMHDNYLIKQIQEMT